jgi:hypothetical protein
LWGKTTSQLTGIGAEGSIATEQSVLVSINIALSANISNLGDRENKK